MSKEKSEIEDSPTPKPADKPTDKTPADSSVDLNTLGEELSKANEQYARIGEQYRRAKDRKAAAELALNNAIAALVNNAESKE